VVGAARTRAAAVRQLDDLEQRPVVGLLNERFAIT
jgi:hypothetical protein